MMIEPIRTAADWRGEEMSRRTDWIHELGRDEVDEIERALASVKARGIDIADIDRSNFPLSLFPRVAGRALEFLEDGPGLFHIRGLPALVHTAEDMRLVYWGLGKYLGTAVSQSRKGDVLGDVRDLDINNTGLGRGYQSRKAQEFHTDSCDVVGLLIHRTAKTGGLSKIVSSVAVHNQMLAERPDLLEALYRPFRLYTPDFGPDWWEQPMLSVHEGHFSCKTVGLYAILAQRQFPDIPRLTPAQQEAMELFRVIANRPGMHFTMMFKPGDLQLLNNHVTLHGRTGFEDFDEPDRRRHLFRLWLSVPNSRPLAPLMANFYRDGRPGAVRGGYRSQSGKTVYESLVE